MVAAAIEVIAEKLAAREDMHSQIGISQRLKIRMRRNAMQVIEKWSGRGDLNARPPAPKRAKSVPGGLSIFANS